jgi:peptide/nickel transport system permease protein/nickel transport system permease protein
VSLTAALSLVAIITVAGTILGIAAGYFGGAVDAVIMRLADLMISFPGMVLAIAVAGILGANIKNAVIAIAVVSWTKYARLARSLVLKIRNQDYIKAAIVTGTKTRSILLKYLLPNVLPTMVITGATDIGGMMLEIAALSFLGFGAQSPTAEWGLMLNEGRDCMTNAPWMMIFPGLAIFVTVVVFNLLGDSLRDVLDPKD